MLPSEEEEKFILDIYAKDNCSYLEQCYCKECFNAFHRFMIVNAKLWRFYLVYRGLFIGHDFILSEN